MDKIHTNAGIIYLYYILCISESPLHAMRRINLPLYLLTQSQFFGYIQFFYFLLHFPFSILYSFFICAHLLLHFTLQCLRAHVLHAYLIFKGRHFICRINSLQLIFMISFLFFIPLLETNTVLPGCSSDYFFLLLLLIYNKLTCR